MWVIPFRTREVGTKKKATRHVFSCQAALSHPIVCHRMRSHLIACRCMPSQLFILFPFLVERGLFLGFFHLAPDGLNHPADAHIRAILLASPPLDVGQCPDEVWQQLRRFVDERFVGLDAFQGDSHLLFHVIYSLRSHESHRGQSRQSSLFQFLVSILVLIHRIELESHRHALAVIRIGPDFLVGERVRAVLVEQLLHRPQYAVFDVIHPILTALLVLIRRDSKPTL